MTTRETNISGTALVLEGGGMRAAHTAGIVAAFIEHEVWFPYVCGLSAGASNTVNYLARDAERTRMCFVDIAGRQALWRHRLARAPRRVLQLAVALRRGNPGRDASH